MYTVSKGPSKIVAKTRRGFSQNLERLDSRKDSSRKSSETESGETISMPKPIFHSNGKKTVHQRVSADVITPQHEELIRYVTESWIQTAYGDSEPSSPISTICSDNSSPSSSSSTSSRTLPESLYYHDEPPSRELQNFKPFDLETWWSKRIYQNITDSL